MTTPVVLVPGLGLGPEAYAPTLCHLEMPYEVVTLPGYGERAGRGDDLHIEALAEQLAIRLEKRAVVVGHSASCQIAVAAALARPDMVAGLVLIAPTGDLAASSWPVLAGRLTRSVMWGPPWLAKTLTPQYLRTSVPTILRAIDAARRYDLAAAVPKLSTPVVVVRSKHDRLSPPLWTQKVADLSHGEAWTLPRGSHMPVLTNGRELAAFIQRYAGLAPQD